MRSKEISFVAPKTSNAILMKHFIVLMLFVLLMPNLALSQATEDQYNKPAFEVAYQACPNVPRGLLEAVSFTNTRFFWKKHVFH